jgi:hypothetical protein
MMETRPHVDALKSDLAAVAGDDERLAAAADRLGHALESSVQLRMLDALGEAALELSEQMTAGHVEVRLAGRDVRLVYVADDLSSAVAADDEGTARITLRLPEGVKTRVETAAAREGISANTWLVQAVRRGLDQRAGRRVGARVTGFAQS